MLGPGLVLTVNVIEKWTTIKDVYCVQWFSFKFKYCAQECETDAVERNGEKENEKEKQKISCPTFCKNRNWTSASQFH